MQDKQEYLPVKIGVLEAFWEFAKDDKQQLDCKHCEEQSVYLQHFVPSASAFSNPHFSPH
jgi:hypothetical protein